MFLVVEGMAGGADARDLAFQGGPRAAGLVN